MSHQYVHHPWTHDRKDVAPVQVAAQLPVGTAIQRFNTALAVRVTAGVGTMICAYVFTAIALISLPAAIMSHNVIVIVSWVAQTLLQLVLLSVIIVGQNVQAKAADKQALATYNDGEAALHEILAAQAHLLAQDKLIEDTQASVLAAIAELKGGLHRTRR